ncbi:MAG: lipid-A-disaccharide synthase, partial [Burkholderiales bacterium]
MRVGIVAGEASGDLLGSLLIKALRARHPQIEFIGIAGPKMQTEGARTLFPMERLSVSGYSLEVLRRYREIVGIRKKLIAHFSADPPQVFIGVDAPDFNLGLEAALKARGIPTLHYVSPSIWAWRGERIHKIGASVSRMLTIFPFENALYETQGIPVTYVG